MSGFEAKKKAADLAEVKAQLEKAFADYVSIMGRSDEFSGRLHNLILDVNRMRVDLQDFYRDND